ncbi:MAG: bifunctional salicylyl-CoA 5-hydroxylase/oxidoreductase, partial [Kofleriaceae bacterium]
MKIACIGGGPAGLYLGILVKRVAPEHDVVVYERNRPADTFGFGVVFSDATLGNLATADPETHRQITDRFIRWDDIEIHAGGEVLRSTGHGFCGIER